MACATTGLAVCSSVKMARRAPKMATLCCAIKSTNQMKKLLTFTLSENDQGGLDIECDPDPTAEHFDQFIAMVGALRQQVQPPISVKVPSGLTEMPVATNPGWFVG